MKTIKYIIGAFLVLAGVFSCQDKWDSHYSQEEQQINNDNIIVLNQPAIECIKGDPSLSSMYKLLQNGGVTEKMDQKEDQLFTLIVVNNEGIAKNTIVPTEDQGYLAGTHITDMALSPANFIDGQRILMWNGKYVTVSKVENEDKSYTLYFNDSKVTKITKVSNGYIYEVDAYVFTPKSLYEVVETLDDDYSIFRDMIMSRNQKSFDKKNSMAIGVDNTGSTIYDSIFVITNPYFSAKNFNLMSESLNATMLIPSNEVINRALTEAQEKLQSWGLERADTIVKNWIFQSAFFDTNFKPADFSTIDLTSIFGKQWRTTVQQVDTEHPVTMSNGTAYYVKWMKIPTNVLIYRMKDYMKWYEFLTAEEKETYFVTDNLTFNKLNTDVAGWSGWPAGGFPLIENRVLMYNLTDDADATPSKQYTLIFTPFKYNVGSGATPYKFPPGEYELSLGFKQSMAHDIDIFINDETTPIKQVTIAILNGTLFHYDRGEGGYPEGYDVNKATDSKKGNYDRDGGKTGTITITGSEPQGLKIKLKGVNIAKGKPLVLHHWCMKPTKNCY